MKPFDPANLSEWLRVVMTTEDEEINCDAMAEVIPSVVEAGARGEDIAALLPEISLHLDHCPDCRDWYQTLVEIARQSNT
jgi:predicted anti-sigma-YlaC factor YlaD